MSGREEAETQMNAAEVAIRAANAQRYRELREAFMVTSSETRFYRPLFRITERRRIFIPVSGRCGQQPRWFGGSESMRLRVEGGCARVFVP